MMSAARDDPVVLGLIDVLRQELRSLGWIEGSNVRFDVRWAAGETRRASENAAELVALKPDVILVNGAPNLAAVRRETGTIPIVFVQVVDPVGSGFVPNLTRPGGNVTGFANYEYAIGGKWLETLKEIAPAVRRVLFLHNPDSPAAPGLFKAIEAAAPTLKLAATAAPVRDAAAIEKTLAAFAAEGNGGLVVQPDFVTSVHRLVIVGQAARHRLPAIYPFRSFTLAGGLMSYGIETGDLYKRAAPYIDRILRGEKPGDLPVQLPARFEMMINRKTAQVLGLTIPPALLVRVDEVIE